jgi:XTP/dITP diphosphohydrolase
MPARPDKIVLASGNPGKVAEIAGLLADLRIEVVPQSELGVTAADETGTTFTENALIKAQHAVDSTGLPAIADDSGICVDALDGRPGVRSARYAGPDATDDGNNELLLTELAGVPDERRGAAFHCVACFIAPGMDEPVIAEGEWRGRILHERRGEGGFGYDPLFYVPELGKSSAELAPQEKNARSHRGQAIAELGRKLHAIEWD